MPKHIICFECITAKRPDCIHQHSLDRQVYPGRYIESDERYTPLPIINAATRCMGTITLDVASCAYANLTVKAEHFYTKEDNALIQRWYGSIWCNPPYSVLLQQPFLQKLLTEYKLGNITQAIAMLPSTTLFSVYSREITTHPTCLLKHCQFYTPSGKKVNYGLGFVLVYLGKNVTAFYREFSPIGAIVQQIERPTA